ncbi:MAG: phage major tail tube protein [Cyanobacteria bacterium SBC]|nr:phage major tail tube protein [Cyanobacteria bacterium SBC]
MPVYTEKGLRAYFVSNGQEIPAGAAMSEIEYNIPIQTEDYESVGKFFKVAMTTGIDPMEGEATFIGMPTNILSLIQDFKTVHEMHLFTRVQGESAESTEADVIDRHIMMLVKFMDDLPGGSREHAAPAEYETTFQIRELRVKDNNTEILYANAFEESYRVNGKELINLG